MGLILFFGLIIAIVGIGGIISGIEAALLSISMAKVRDLYNNSVGEKERKKAENLLYIKENLQDYITTVVVLTNAINIIGSTFLGVLAARIFGSAYVGVVSAIVTFLIIEFSEIIPKIYGERYALKLSMISAIPLIYFTKMIKPLLYLLNLISSLFVKEKGNIVNISEGEIREMASMGYKKGMISAYENRIINRVFFFNDIEAKEIMIPKKKVSFIEESMKIDEIVNLVNETGYTRFPVKKRRKIIGLINVKDVLKFKKNKKNFSISKILRPIIFVPETIKLLDLEKRMNLERNHMVGILNEHGDFVGIVTLEMLIEELIGEEIFDEFDLKEPFKIRKITKKRYQVRGNCGIKELNEKLNLKLPITQKYYTIGGYLQEKLGKIPEYNDRIKLRNAVIRVTDATKESVEKVEIRLKKDKKKE